jgi:hypothetical protein
VEQQTLSIARRWTALGGVNWREMDLTKGLSNAEFAKRKTVFLAGQVLILIVNFLCNSGSFRDFFCS